MTNLEKVKEKIKIIFPVVDKLSLETLSELKRLIDVTIAESMPQKEFNEKVIDKLLWKHDKDFMVVFTVEGFKFGLFAKGKEEVHTKNAIQFLQLFARIIQSTQVKPIEKKETNIIKLIN